MKKIIYYIVAYFSKFEDIQNVGDFYKIKYKKRGFKIIMYRLEQFKWKKYDEIPLQYKLKNKKVEGEKNDIKAF